MHHLKQGSDSIDNYNRNFFRLSTQISSLTLHEKFFKYKIGLNDRMRYEVESKNPRSLEHAIATATQYEHSYRNDNVEIVNTMSMRNNRHNQEVFSGRTRFHPAQFNSFNTYKPISSYCHKRSENTND